MKLTNQLRDVFINGVMRDVPSVDYTEQIRALMIKDLEDQLPPTVYAIYKDPKTVEFVRTSWGSFNSGVTITFPSNGHGEAQLTTKTRHKVDELKTLMKQQESNRTALRTKLKSVAYSVTTRKALVQALPEFEKYLPEDEAKAVRTLPVVQNVVADFVKAGWPTSKKGNK